MSSLQIFIFFSAYSEEKMLTPQSVLANSINAIFFRIFSETSQKIIYTVN